MSQDTRFIVSISMWDSLRIHLLSCVYGVWVLSKRLARWMWDPQGFFLLQRDNPPSCLLDSSLGQHKYVKLKGVKLHYVEAGDRKRPLVLLLHGFPDCWLGWRHQIPLLAQHFRVVALDLKGFGDSDKPPNRRSYKVENLLAELQQFVTALGAQECVLLGHDLGAILGWFLIHQNPSLVSVFVSVSCPHPNVTPLQQGLSWPNYVQLPHLPELDALHQDVRIISEYHKHLQQKDNIYLEAYKYSFSRKEDWTGALNYYRNLPFSRISALGNPITTPILLVTGSKDPLVSLEAVVKSTEYCELSNVRIIDGASHFPHQENPALFNKLILKYLGRRLGLSFAEQSPSKGGLVDRMLGAVSSRVSSTVKLGNSVLDSVQKRTNVLTLTSLSLGGNSAGSYETFNLHP